MYKIGQGIDIHKLKKGKKIILAGQEYDSDYSIDAYSDGDIILHSLSSAILGAISLNDLGTYFPDNNLANKNRSSMDFVKFSLKEMSKRNLEFENIDINIICEQIIFKAMVPTIKISLSGITNCSNISVKATRFEDDANMSIQVFCNILLKNIKKMIK